MLTVYLGLHFLVVSSLLELEVALRFSYFDIVQKSGSESFLFGYGLLDLRVGASFGLSDARVSLHFRRARLAERLQVALQVVQKGALVTLLSETPARERRSGLIHGAAAKYFITED